MTYYGSKGSYVISWLGVDMIKYIADRGRVKQAGRTAARTTAAKGGSAKEIQKAQSKAEKREKIEQQRDPARRVPKKPN